MRFLVIASILLVGCSAEQHQQQPTAKVLDQGQDENDLIRYEDKELGVVCYRVRYFEGVSCVKKNLPHPEN